MEETIDAKLIYDLIVKFENKFQTLSPDTRVGQCTLTVLSELNDVYNTKTEKQYTEAEIKSWNGMSQ